MSPTLRSYPSCGARTASELHDRQVELDAILATAPAAVRGLIEKVQNMEALPFDEIKSLLGDVSVAHRERQRWILQHWPHVVDAAQVVRARDVASAQIEAPIAPRRPDDLSNRRPRPGTI